jgi:NADH-quinone oxidoreductase subunit M
MRLTALLFLPLVGGLLSLTASWRPGMVRWLALGTTVAELILAGSLLGAGTTGARWLLALEVPWVPSLGIHYGLGVDGVSLVLVLLTAFLSVLCVLVSWRAVTDRVGLYHFFLLAAETGILGVFLATDLFLFYLFWEVQMVPVFFLVGIWGHEERIQATLKFLIYTVAGSLLMLLAVALLYSIHGAQTGTYTFRIADLLGTDLGRWTPWVFGGLLAAFAVKIPVIPIHNWLPDAHTQAPTAGSVILAGLLLKTGAYALFRVALPLAPQTTQTFAPVLVVLGLLGLFYAAWVAFDQVDAKRLVAYSSIAHMGVILIGFAVWTPATLSGSLLQMLNHGLSTAALFILLGMMQERVGSRALADLGGLWGEVPVLSGFFLLFALSALGLPGLNNFVGETLILVGTFPSRPLVASLGFCGLVFTLAYMLRLIQQALFGPPKPGRHLPDATAREVLVLTCLAVGVLFIGLHPQPVLDLFEGPVARAVGQTALAVLP